ncbi:sulfurtransferase TusA family protein [Alteribacter natronophilus]|uniref:sulfurtransferase TusA family protein n=1 Tax=Alteribacter natronophilus TaxID=2583810 RepID=UPI00110E9F83|nr:sulfurtransferase TusA family protein [Alteribacter natronophilus]TMW72998.1 hypothetical protein FGB90_01435 [Alteribacter natronophilus]
MTIKSDHVLDARGLACPMPIVKTKKEIDRLTPGAVLEIQATDKGSLADMKGWAKNTGHDYLGTKEEGDVLIHYIRKANPDEVKEDSPYEPEVSNEQLEAELKANKTFTLVDVREPAEYAFTRIPKAVSIPLGELENRTGELNKEEQIYVVCRTGNRSGMAAGLLKEAGFEKVTNVKPGMSGWSGDTESDQ